MKDLTLNASLHLLKSYHTGQHLLQLQNASSDYIIHQNSASTFSGSCQAYWQSPKHYLKSLSHPPAVRNNAFLLLQHKEDSVSESLTLNIQISCKSTKFILCFASSSKSMTTTTRIFHNSAYKALQK